MGDGYEFGFYRGKYIAASRNVIVVEHNYRLGALGLLALPQLRAASIHNSTGNLALQDQLEALAFVYRNIAEFTGNPKQITIFGESAGAFSVCWHLVNPISRQYFSTAVMQSGTCAAPEFFISLKRGEEKLGWMESPMYAPSYAVAVIVFFFVEILERE